MPEGFTKSAIIPGDSYFYEFHEDSLKLMLKLLKQANSKALINVYHSTTKYPEIAGLNGFVYEIPNIKVQKQIDEGILDADDFGQATFKILDLQGYNTFDNIKFACKTQEELNKLKKCFYKARYPKEILSILIREIENKKKEIVK